jgi:hypothetical protein
MPGSIQSTVILFKPETTSGTDAAPVEASDAVLVRVTNLSVQIDEKFADRDVLVGAFGASDSLPYARRGTISFSVEIQASGVLGTAPMWGDLLLCSAFSETVTATTRVDYLPASSSLKTGTIWALWNGRLEKFNYASGDVTGMSWEVGKVPTMDYKFMALVSSSAAGSLSAPTLTGFKRPEAVSTAATTKLSIGPVTYTAGAISGGTQYNWQSLKISMGNDVQDLALVGQENIAIYGRKPTVEIVGDFGATAHAAFKADMHAGTTRAFGFIHGSAATLKVGVHAPVGVITEVSDQVNGNVMLDKLKMTLRPSTANDELRIFCI